MAIARKNINSEDDFLKVSPDATATFNNSAGTPPEDARRENLRAVKIEDDDLEEEDTDEEEEDFDDEDDDDDEDEDEDYEDEIDDDEEDEENHDLVTGPKAPRVYRRS